MKRELLPLLACPDCQGDIDGDFEEELEHGEIHCRGCSRVFPVNHGVPSLLPSDGDSLAVQVAGQFAEQWKRYDQWRPEYRQQFLDWLSPVEPDFFTDKVVLDAGCGKGRHLRVSAELGPKLVVGVDLGESAYVAREATRNLENVAIVRGDLLRLPFRSGVFDYAYSVGVLHHLPDPRAGFNSILTTIQPGGHLSAWVYGYENNEWIVRLVNPIREHVTSRIPRPLLKMVSWLGSGFLGTMIHGIYRPWNRLFPHQKLFYQDYLLYIANLPLAEIETIVYDQLHPSVAFYLPQKEFESWFVDLDEVVIGWHNRNSWRGFARKPTD